MRQLLHLGRRRNVFTAFLLVAILLFALAADSLAKTPPRYAGEGPVTEVPRFVGTHSETWEGFPVRDFGPVETIFGGAAVISGTRLETATDHQFLLCAYYASPVDGEIFMGADQYGSSMTISFSQPVSAFGAYWANVPAIPAGCGGGETSFVFVDGAGNWVGEQSYPAGNTANWHWHGWVFATPVKTISITGDYVVTDGMQANVPLANSLSNISTRGFVQTGDNVFIGGFIVNGTGQKTVVIRGIGPSLGGANIAEPLADPTLELHSGSAIVASNDNWKDSQRAAIEATGLAPENDLESAIIATLDPGPYTAILAGKNAGTGVGLVEVYNVNPAANSNLANISTRGFVRTGDNVMIGGFILHDAAEVMVRGLGPSLAGAGVSSSLADPFLELHAQDGTIIASNDDWRESQQAEIEATGIPPTQDKESAIWRALPPGNYTAIVRGVNNTTGNALVEVYAR
jgi:uncharacterized Zn-binding protein involved in type VI secretion